MNDYAGLQIRNYLIKPNTAYNNQRNKKMDRNAFIPKQKHRSKYRTGKCALFFAK